MDYKVIPNFIIAGVARCGTTSLYHYMKQHPQIGFSSQKEPKYFSSIHLEFPHRGIGDDTVDSVVVKNPEDYYKLFNKLNGYKAIGEASSDYLYFHKYTVDAIKKELGDVSIIISIRNPVDRAYSAYNNLVRDGREKLSFMEALNAEEERIANNWDWMWAYKKGSLYAEAIEHFQREFTNVKVILFDDLEKDPHIVLQEIFDFLNINTNVVINCETKYSNSGKPKNFFIATLADRNNKFTYKLRKIVMNIVPRSVLEKIAERVLKKEKIPSEALKYLKQYFIQDIEKVEKLIDKDLSKWKE